MRAGVGAGRPNGTPDQEPQSPGASQDRGQPGGWRGAPCLLRIRMSFPSRRACLSRRQQRPGRRPHLPPLAHTLVSSPADCPRRRPQTRRSPSTSPPLTFRGTVLRAAGVPAGSAGAARPRGGGRRGRAPRPGLLVTPASPRFPTELWEAGPHVPPTPPERGGGRADVSAAPARWRPPAHGPTAGRAATHARRPPCCAADSRG